MIHRMLWTTILGIILTGLLSACDNSGQSTPASSKSPPQVVQMRGTVEALPNSVLPRGLRIHHEATADMGSMTMLFTAAEGVSLKDLAVGDKIAFRLESDPAGDDLITAIEKLPADTVLNFGAASLPATK